MPEFRPVIVIPVYDHDLCIAEITERLARHWPVILVDDGSHAKCAAVLDAVAATVILESYLAWRKNHKDEI